MSVEVLPSGSSTSRRKMGRRFVFRSIFLAIFVICILGWFVVSRSPTFSWNSGSSSQSLKTFGDPLLAGLEQEIQARKLAAGGAANLFPVDPDSTKLVLFWTPFFGSPDSRGTLGSKLFEGCPVHQCSATGDKSQIAKSSAVIFHALDIDPSNLPGPRLAGQHYVFLIGESPANSFGRIEKTPENFFDLTFSYNLDSDVRGHYMYSVSLEKPPKNFAKGKTKLVAWFVSNCKTSSKREDFVKKLQKFVDVDVFGKCGPLKCPRNNEAACNEMLKNDYKFYLAFENSICQDYVTEKFTNALHNLVVPVVLGNGNMTIFPAKSYIHVDQFPSVKALAEYLQFVDKNDTVFNEFMNWRFDPSQIESHGQFSPASSSWCMLCERLHDPALQTTGYPDARKWFFDNGKCRL